MEKQANYALICVALFLICFFAPSSAQQQTNCSYKITIKTANIVNAGTTSKIGLSLCYHKESCFASAPDLAKVGDNGTNYTYFREGSVDNFTLTARQCLRACLMKLNVQSNGDRPTWIVQDVKIQTIYPNTVRVLSFQINELLFGGTSSTYDQCSTPKFQPDNLELFGEA